MVLQCRDTARWIQRYACTTQTAVKQAIRSLSALPCCWQKQSRSICEVTEQASFCLLPVECKLTSTQTAWQTQNWACAPGQTALNLLLNYKGTKTYTRVQSIQSLLLGYVQFSGHMTTWNYMLTQDSSSTGLFFKLSKHANNWYMRGRCSASYSYRCQYRFNTFKDNRSLQIKICNKVVQRKTA